MKVTIEQLKNLNVEGYVQWLISEAKNMQVATLSLPFHRRQLDEISVQSFTWYTYELKKIISEHWYLKYKELYALRVKDIKQYIAEAERSLRNASSLAESKKVVEISTEIASGKRMSFDLECAKSINFEEVNSNIALYERLFYNSIEQDVKDMEERHEFNKMTAQDELTEVQGMDFAWLEYIQKAIFCKQFFYDINTVMEFAKLEYYSRLAKGGDTLEVALSSEEKLTCAEKLKLVEAVGVFDLPFFSIHPISGTHTKESHYKLLADILGESMRHVKGNLLAMRSGKANPPYNPNSEKIKYKIDKYLDKLK